MTVHLINPSHVSFGIGIITPRWLYVLAGATPAWCGDPKITDETLELLDYSTIHPGDVVGIGIHTGNALEGYRVGTRAREAGAKVIFGGIHATLFPEEVLERGGAHAVVLGDGESIWSTVLEDCRNGTLRERYQGGRVDGDSFVPGRWDLLPEKRYMMASVQTVRGCPKHCSFCSVWRTDGQRPRVSGPQAVVTEIVDLRRRGFRFIVLADDNFYPVTLTDLEMASRVRDKTRFNELSAIRAERFELMELLAQLPDDSVFFTQITMEAAEDPAFMDAMRRAHIRGALVGVESVTPEGLKDVMKGFNAAGSDLVERLQTFRKHDLHVLGSFIFGLPSDKPATFEATGNIADQAGVTFAQFLMLTPFPGTVDFAAWEKKMADDTTRIHGIPLTRHWLIPQGERPKIYQEHPLMNADEILKRTQGVWDQFYSWGRIWNRSRCVESMKSRVAFLLVSKLYRQMYAKTGISTDSARVDRAATWARWIAKPCRRLFAGRALPDLKVPLGAGVSASV